MLPDQEVSNHRDTGQEKTVTCFAPAKINLALHVTGQHSDGYHELETLVVFCDIGDEIEIYHGSAPGSQPDGPRIDLANFGPYGETLPDPQDNIVYKAAMAFTQEFLTGEQSLTIRIEKNLPVASGIGGGSADAAATLLAVQDLFETRDEKRMAAIAANLGADVPMCLHSRALIARGRGEQIELLEEFPQLHMVLVNPGVCVSTPEVFGKLQGKQNPPLTPLPAKLTPDTLIRWLHQKRNDLAAPALALAPEIHDVLEALRSSDALLRRMSGSGATCFGIYPSFESAENAALQISQNQPGWWVKACKSRSFGKERKHNLR